MSQYVKSVQQVNVSLTALQGTGNATITAVNTANSIIIFDGVNNHGASTTSFWNANGIWSFTNSTTVTFTRDSTTTNNVICVARATIVEFNSDVNSIQAGAVTITAGGTSNTATISAVGANAFVLWLGAQTTAGSGGFTEIYGNSVELTNSTTVTARISAVSAQDIKVGYMVVDLTSNIVASVQKSIQASASNTSTSQTATITSVNTSNAIAFYNGVTFGTALSSQRDGAHRLELTNATTLTWTRSTGGNSSRNHYATVVEFQSGALNGAIQRGTIAGDGTNSPTATITAITLAVSFVVWSGWSAILLTGQTGMANERLSATTTVALSFDGLSSTSAITPYQVIQFDNTASTSSDWMQPFSAPLPQHCDAIGY